jgi:hypothetical protein
MDKFRKERWLGKPLVGMLVLAFGLICLTFLVVNLTRDISIWVLGRHTTAEVVDLWLERTSEDGATELTFRYHVQYQFTAPNGQVVTGTSGVSGTEWSGLTQGSPVAVAYFPLYPAHNRLDDSRLIPFLACTYVPLAFLGWAGLVAGWRLVRPDPAGLKLPLLTEILSQDIVDDAPK